MNEDTEGKLWGTTESGVYVFDSRVSSVKNFDNSNGLFVNSFICKGNYKNLIIAGNEGLVYFNPNRLYYNKTIPKTFITSLEVFDEEVTPGKGSILERPIEYTKHITLAYDQRNFSLGFVALNLINAVEILVFHDLPPFFADLHPYQ
jgi:hypothetical protein